MKRLPFSALLFLLALFLTACSGDAGDAPDAPRAAPAGEDAQVTADTTARMAPDFELPTHTGEPFHLAAHRGEVVLLNFWATWCAPCRVEIPDFIKLQNELGDQGLQIVGISMDADGFDAVKPFAEEMGMNYPLVVDIGDLSELYGGVYALPTSILIDRDGRIVRKIPGLLSEKTLRPLLEDLLKTS